MSSSNKKKYVYQPDDGLMNKKINVKAKPEPEIGIDTNATIISQIKDGLAGNGLNIAKIDSFTSISQNRNTIYDLIDTMFEDPTIAAAIEIYCEDSTETNDKGEIMWVESSDKDVTEHVNYLLNDLNIEKNIYSWVKCLVKYGDVYLRLYHKSEYCDDDLFGDSTNKKQLNEDVVLTAFKQSDNFAHYVSMVPNPAEMFELTKFGKSYAYIQAPVTAYMSKVKDSNLAYGNYTYNFKRKDVTVFTADNFVHGSLDEMSSREPEEVNLYLYGDSDDVESKKYTYSVKRGQSILYNSYKIWRENMLLEYALLLNRLSRSSSVKIMNVEVGDMPRNQVNAKLMAVKQLFETKSALATDIGMNEYANSGPAENIVYMASRNGKGAVSTQEISSDLNVTGLDDVNLFRNKLFSSLKIPKNYLGDTDDAGGFDGGTSLSLLSSRYAKTIKRIQNVVIQMITDLINILLVDSGFSSYINKFRLRMQEPTTKEEVDRKDAQVNRITVVQDTMSLFDDIEDPVSRLTILKNLLSSVSTDAEILQVLDENINKFKQQAENPEMGQESDIDDSNFDDMSISDIGSDIAPQPGSDFGAIDQSSDIGSDSGAGELPTPEGLGVDLVNM